MELSFPFSAPEISYDEYRKQKNKIQKEDQLEIINDQIKRLRIENERIILPLKKETKAKVIKEISLSPTIINRKDFFIPHPEIEKINQTLSKITSTPLEKFRVIRHFNPPQKKVIKVDGLFQILKKLKLALKEKTKKNN